MKSNTLTIIKKEFARFFGDRQMLFTTVIMPGLLIYLIYSFMGMAMKKMATEGTNELVTLCVENMPASVAPLIDAIPASAVSQQAVSQEDIDRLEDKSLNVVLVRFPEAFDEKVANYDPQSGIAAPNVEETAFDKASSDEMLGSILSKLIQMLILMLLFSGVMAIAPSAIAGEKERGTIATLLVTPLRRNELALGKVVSLSCIALLSGISSFIGIVLSLPKMIPTDAAGVELGLNFTGSDYVVLLLIIFATVLIMASAVSILSALAKDVKNAGTMITPFMLVVMFCGLTPMFQNGAPESLTAYLIPFYNSIQVMTSVFAHEMRWIPVIVTLAANVVYTGIAVWVLTRMFNSEKVMFSK